MNVDKKIIANMMVLTDAIKSVRELHKPFKWQSTDDIFCDVCLQVKNNEVVQVPYPCPTIQALELKKK